MLIWDLLSFGAGIFAYIFTFKNHPIKIDWEESTPYLFFGKWIYGMLSFPFLLFAVPLV